MMGRLLTLTNNQKVVLFASFMEFIYYILITIAFIFSGSFSFLMFLKGGDRFLELTNLDVSRQCHLSHSEGSM